MFCRGCGIFRYAGWSGVGSMQVARGAAFPGPARWSIAERQRSQLKVLTVAIHALKEEIAVMRVQIKCASNDREEENKVFQRVVADHRETQKLLSASLRFLPGYVDGKATEASSRQGQEPSESNTNLPLKICDADDAGSVPQESPYKQLAAPSHVVRGEEETAVPAAESAAPEEKAATPVVDSAAAKGKTAVPSAVSDTTSLLQSIVCHEETGHEDMVSSLGAELAEQGELRQKPAMSVCTSAPSPLRQCGAWQNSAAVGSQQSRGPKAKAEAPAKYARSSTGW